MGALAAYLYLTSNGFLTVSHYCDIADFYFPIPFKAPED